MARGRKRYSGRSRRGGGLRVLLSFLCVVVTAVCILAAMTLFFQIKTVEIEGETRYSDEEIIAAGGIRMGGNMFLYNKFRSIENILEGCPYVDQIVVRRRLPDTVRIQVSEAVPVVAMQYAGTQKGVTPDGQPVEVPLEPTWFLMDLQHKLLEEVDAETAEKYPGLTGLSLVDPRVGKTAVFSDEQKGKQAFMLLNTAKNNDILNDIQWIDVERSYALKLQYTDRFTVNFGTVEDLDRKCRFMLVVADKLDPRDVGTIDVSDTATARFMKK